MVADMELSEKDIETLREAVDGCGGSSYTQAIAILDRLSPAPEVDEATKIWREMNARGCGEYSAEARLYRSGERDSWESAKYEIPYLRQAIADLIASKDGEIEGWKATAQTASDNVFLATDRVFAAEAETTRVTKVAEKAESELAALRAENERLKADRDWWKADAQHEFKAAERNTAEPVIDGQTSVFPPDAYGKVHTDGSRSGGMPPGTNAGAVEVTQAAATSAQIYADFHCEDGSFNVIVAERLAAEFDRVRTEAEARGRRQALEEVMAQFDAPTDTATYARAKILGMMTGEK